MANISIAHVFKTFPSGYDILKDINLEIKSGEIVVFVGPSGCGKSTILRAIAGLEEITSGVIRINGERLEHIAPEELNMTMLLQNYALYPKLTVAENIGFGLKQRSVPELAVAGKVREIARFLDLTDVLRKKPKALSASQRQRVAMGRALVNDPDTILLDEPLASLEAERRSRLIADIVAAHERLRGTILYVTHDLKEARALAGRIVIMDKGAVQQAGSVAEIERAPANLFVADYFFDPPLNLLAGSSEVWQDQGYIVTAAGEFKVYYPHKDDRIYWVNKKRPVRVAIRPGDIRLAAGSERRENTAYCPAVVQELKQIDGQQYLRCALADTSLLVQKPAAADLPVGAALTLAIRAADVLVYDEETKQLLR